MKGCLVVHGLTGTPATVDSVREKLLAAGYKVVSPCLAGHGGSIGDLEHTRWQDWYETVRAAYSELRRSTEKVYYVGLSLGALLGLKLAIDEKWGVRALALLSPALRLRSINHYFVVPVVRYSPLRFIIRSVKKNYEKSVSDPEGRKIYQATSLPCFPGEAVYQLWDFQRELIPELNKVTSPVMIIHAKGDHLTPVQNMRLLQDNLGSDIIETTDLDDTSHVITLGKDKELVANKVVEFFDKFA